MAIYKTNAKTTTGFKKPVKLKYIKEHHMNFFKEILTAETIGTKEYIIRDTLVERLQHLGFEVSVDSIGNISAVRGKGPYALLNAHMDIVDNSWSYSYSSSYSSSYYGDYYSNYTDELSCYENDYDFYLEIYEIIQKTRQNHEDKKTFLKDLMNQLEPKLKRLGERDLENMNLDCGYCKSECKNFYICDKFYLKELNSKLNLENEETDKDDLEYIELENQYKQLESFVETLEDYCFNATSAFEEAAYDESYELEHPDESEETESFGKAEEYEVIVDLENNKIKGKGKPRVLGGDDKCGVFISLMVAELLPEMPLKILFTVQEETGCIGIKHFIKENREFFSDIKYSLTIDRRDRNHLLWAQLGKRSCDDEFAGLVAREGVRAGIDVKLAEGTVADVIYIRDIVPNAINMSAGYYDAHTNSEYIVPTDVDNIIGWVKNIVTNI